MSGAAITVSENNIKNISSIPVVFSGSSTEEKTANSVPASNNANMQNQNCQNSLENHSPKQVDMNDHLSHLDSNHILRPAMTENIKQELNSKSIPMQGKAILLNNCSVEKKLNKGMTTIGASGDGLPQNENIMLLKNQANIVSSTTTKDNETMNGNLSGSKTKFTAKAPGPTYAIAARTAAPNSVPKTKNEDPVSRNMKAVTKDTKISTVSKSPVIMNGNVEDSSPKVQDAKPVSKPSPSANMSSTKALKETIGHISTRLPDESTNTGQGIEAQSTNDQAQEIQILSNPDRMTDATGPSDSSKENTTSNIDQDALSAKLSSNSLRREAEKPPRMQKQRSQDRLLSKQQKPSFEVDKRETLSRESSVECLDSTGVDVHEFLINTLRNSTRDRAILLKIEHDMIDFVNDKTIDFMKFPPMTSYHRMLVHRVAAYFGMDHNVDETGKSVIINKTSSTRIPESRFADQFDPRHPDQHSCRRDDDMRRRSILKRTNQSRSFDRDDMRGGGHWKDNRQRSIEEREEQYEKVRARIFNNPEVANMQSPIYGRRGMSSIAAARIASWTDRPWNSTDLEPMSAGMRMPLSRPLTTRASSYSSISVLPRHNSATSVKTGSSSSVSSVNGVNNGMQNYPQNIPPPNMGHPRPPTPNRRSGGNSTMNDSNNGTFYYMQQQNQGLPYLSPEGYQLFYQSGGNNTGMTSPQFAQYYQMPPQPSPNHPSMAYAHGYNNIYQESPQKGGSVPQASTSTDYTMMSNYQQNLSSTTTVYSGVQAQNTGYSYQPTTSSTGGYNNRSSHDQPVTPSSQAVIQINPMATNTNVQGKQTPIPQNPNYIQQQQPPTPAGYPQYVLTQHPAVNTAPVPGQQQTHPSAKDATSLQNPHGGVVTPRPMLAQPVPMMQHPSMYQQQQAMHVIYSPPNAHNVTVSTPSNPDTYNQPISSKDAVKSSNKQQEPKQIGEDELNEKMQAIVLKNLQQQQEQSQVSDVTTSNSTSTTVTTSSSPSTNQIQVTKQLQSHPIMPDQTGQNRIYSHPPPAPHQVPSGNSQLQVPHGYQYHQYTNPSGMPQQMQVYLMPANVPNTGNASYRTYSQFMTPPQTPHVVGTAAGMHLVYLSPPPMMGMENSSTISVPTSVPTMMHNSAYHHHHPHPSHNSQISADPAAPPAYTSNTNNNNAQSITEEITSQNYTQNGISESPSGHGAAQINEIDDNNAEKLNSVELNGSPPDEVVNANQETVISKENLQPSTGNEELPATELPADTVTPKETSTQSHVVTADTSVEEKVDQNPTIMTNATQSTHIANNHMHHHHHHAATVQYTNSPLMIGNIQPDYRMAGVAMNTAPSFPTRVIPQYSMYPGITQTPYVYLPTTPSNHNPKISEVKIFPTQAASPTPGLIAVHVPNQNHIQLVPAASLQQHQQNPIYYASRNYMTTDYTNQQPVAQTQQPQPYTTTQSSYAKQEAAVPLAVNDQNHVADVPEVAQEIETANVVQDSCDQQDNKAQEETAIANDNTENSRFEENKE